MIRILHMVGNMGLGGQETFIMNVYRNINREKFQFDFVVHSNKRGYYDDEIEKLGGKIYRITPISKNPFKHMLELKKIFIDNEYKVFHRHTCSAIAWIDLYVAQKCNVAKRIIHSHNSNTSKKISHYLFKGLIKMSATDMLACSKYAGKWLFKNQPFVVINNGIEINKYIYDPLKRKVIRDKYNVCENEILLGHVGRFNVQKNHKYLLEIFNEYHKINPASKLMLVGDGELRSEIEKQIGDLKLEKSVILVGKQSHVEDFYNAMDMFVFPSLYEGLPIVLLEAQVNGLKCVTSQTVVSDEANLTGNIIYISLQDKLARWSEEIFNSNFERYNEIEKIIEKGYDIKDTVKQLEKIYLNN